MKGVCLSARSRTAMAALRALAAAAAFGAASAATGQSIDFEPPAYAGSPGGTLLAGQSGWTTPGGSEPFRVHTYAANSLGFASNPAGGTQFSAAQAGAGTARAQRSTNFAATDLYRVSFDTAVKFNGALPATGNPGSFSLQPTSNRHFRTVNRWVNPATCAAWNATYNIFDSSGVLMAGSIAGPEWQNLTPNHWYRQSTLIDFNANQVLEVSITNLHTGATTTVMPVGWYMEGGSSPAVPRATAIRTLVDGAGNAVAYDNVRVEQVSMIHAGMAISPLGQAHLAETPQGMLRLSNIGSSGQDGVRLHLPESQSLGTSVTIDPAAPIGAEMISSAIGIFADGREASVGSLGMRRSAQGFTVLPDYAPVGSPAYDVIIRNDGQEVLRRNGLSGPVVSFDTAVRVKIDCWCDWGNLSWSWRITIEVPWNVAGVLALGDEIEFRPHETPSLPQRVTTAEIRANMDPPDIDLRLAMIGHSVKGLGSLVHPCPPLPGIPHPRGLCWLLTGLCGILLDVQHTDAFTVGGMLDPAMPLGATMESETAYAGGETPRFVTTRTPQGFAVDVDYSDLGSPTYTCEVSLGGQIVATRSGLSGPAVEMNPTVATKVICKFKFIPPTLTWTFGGPRNPVPMEMRIGGQVVVGDAVEFRPDGGSVPIEIVSLSLIGTNMPQMMTDSLSLEMFGHDHTAVGHAVLEPQSNAAGMRRLPVRNLGSSGQDGVEVQLKRETSLFGVNLEPLGDADTYPDGAHVEMVGMGLDGGSVRPISRVRAADTGSAITNTFDFAPSGAGAHRLDYSCQGVPAGSTPFSGPTSEVESARFILKILLTYDRNGEWNDIHISWDSCLSLRPPGLPPVVADNIDAFTEGPAQFIDYASAILRAKDIPRVVIAGESFQGSGCYADCERDGTLDIFDFLCFQNRYDQGDPYACDCDVSSGPGLCDIFDFLCFQNAYAAGCP